MGNGLLSRVNWGGTLGFMLIRIAFGTVGLFFFFLIAGGVPGGGMPGGMSAGNILALPILAVILSGMSLVGAWLSQLGVPFAGVFSMVCSIPMYIGDPMVWVLHKVRPQWVPVAQPSFINPPLVWVLND